MSEVYQIRQERDQDKDTVRYLIDRLDIVAPKATALMQSAVDACVPVPNAIPGSSTRTFAVEGASPKRHEGLIHSRELTSIGAKWLFQTSFQS